nr:hypothetical protein [Anaerolineae bacterium]
MSTVYAQSRATSVASIRRIQKIPRRSIPRVLVGQTVKATEILAVTEVVSKHRVVNVAERLGINPRKVEASLVKREGELVEQGEPIAVRGGFLRKRRVGAPISGRIVRVESGQMLIEGERITIEVKAPVPGRIVDIVQDEYILLETTGAQIQIAWGHGELTWGTLKVLDEEPSMKTDSERFNIDHRGAIVAIGSPLTPEFLKSAADIRVKGVIASSMNASLIPLAKEMEFPVGITQGFGQLAMSERILSLLKNYNGREIAIDMGDSADWRKRRPEIIIPLTSLQQSAPDDRLAGGKLRIGYHVRILQLPHLGEIGIIMELPAEERRLETGLWAAGALVELGSGEKDFIPVANLEYLG